MVEGYYIPAICEIKNIDFEALKEFMCVHKYDTHEHRPKYPKYYDHSAVFYGSIYSAILDGLRVANNIDEKLYVGYLSTGERYTIYNNEYEDYYEKIFDILVDIEFLKPVDSPYNPGQSGCYSIN